MKTLKISNAELKQWLADWQQDYPLFVPMPGTESGREHIYDWQPWTGEGVPEIPAGVVKNSIKRFYQPQPQTLGTFIADARQENAFLLEETLPDSSRQQIIFGVRPCDARGVLLENQILAEDPYFQALREKNILVGICCDTRLPTCFCHETGSSPYSFMGLDIALTRLDDGWLAEIITPRGETLATGGQEATEDEVAAQKERRVALPQSSPAASFKKRPMTEMYEADLWQKYSDRCISCGTCTFLCPTCSCFDIQDESLGSRGRRIRIWDSCMTPLFTAHTSGHNPRGSKLSRVRQRFMHKLKYYPDDHGPLYCVGCGRCVRDCPTNIDIREIIAELSSMNEAN